MIDRALLHREGWGPPLVLIHGLGLDHRCWAAVAAALARDFTVLTYDLPGHGLRGAPPAYSIADLSKELTALLDDARIARAHVVGFSLGGMVAQYFAATEAQRVDRLVLLDTVPVYDETWQRIWPERAATARAQGMTALVDGVLAGWFTPAFIAADPPELQQVREVFTGMPPEGYARGCEALAAADARLFVPGIKNPTLIVCGRDDGPHFKAAATWFADAISGASVQWLDGKHAAALERPADFAAILRAFLR